MIIATESLPVNGFDFARSIIEQRGDEAVEILLKCANGAETDWLEKKAAVYPSETADSEYRAKLQKLENAPQATLQKEKKLYCDKLLKEIACAIVALHNSRGGVVFIGITNDNEPVPFVDCNGMAQPNLTGSEAEDFIRKDIVSRLCPGDGYFECKDGTWRIPVPATSFFPKICRFRGLPVVALLVPARERGKPPIVTTLTQNNKPKDLALTRFPGDVGETRKRKDEDQWVDTEAQRVKFLNDRDTAFLCREDLSNLLKDLGIPFSHLRSMAADAVPAREVYSSVNPPQASIFVGRTKELESIHKLLQEGRIPIITAPGGTGKSELAFQYAERHRDDYPGGLFQINMETIRNWDEVFQDIGRASGKILELERQSCNQGQNSGNESPTGVGDIRKALIRRVETIGSILLVLDNVESVKAFFKEPTLQKQSLPTGVHILATARSCDINFPQSGTAKEFPLCDLSPEEALDLLIKERPAISEKERKAAENIASLLGYRALHLRAIPALLDDAYSPLANSYVALEDALRKNLLETVDKAMEEYEEGERTPSVLWSLTCESLLNYPAGSSWVKLAHIASFFSPDGFRQAILRHLWGKLAAPDANNDLALNQALAILKKHGLVADAGQTLRMHRLTAAAVRRSARERDSSLEEEVGKELAKYDGTSSEDWLNLSGNVNVVKFAPVSSLMANLNIIHDIYGRLSLQIQILLRNPNFQKEMHWNAVTGEEWAALLGRHPQFADICPWDNLTGEEWVALLGKQPQFADNCPWDKLTGGEWAVLLCKQPQFVSRCQLAKFSGIDWSDILREQPQFADICPWEVLNGHEWAWLLAQQPQFAKHCAWETLDGHDWAFLLGDQPQFADCCPLDKFKEWNQYDWKFLLEIEPQFADRCPWEVFDGHAWADLLCEQPQFSNRCPWEKLDGQAWAKLLCAQPQFSDYCLWEKLDGENWANLLGGTWSCSAQPQFSNHCAWEKLDSKAWADLISRQPQFSDHCPWEKLNGQAWARLIGAQPQFSDHCPWEKFDGEDWVNLLGGNSSCSAQPQFSNHCAWEKLDSKAWADLIGRQPQFSDRCPWEKLDGQAWAKLIVKQPKLVEDCPWEKLDGWAWTKLLSALPQFADRCPWEKLDGQAWTDLLIARPEFADYYEWESLDDVAWTRLIVRQPQFVDICPWDKFNGHDWAYLLSIRSQFADKCKWEKLDENDWKELLSNEPKFAKYHLGSANNH